MPGHNTTNGDVAMAFCELDAVTTAVAGIQLGEDSSKGNFPLGSNDDTNEGKISYEGIEVDDELATENVNPTHITAFTGWTPEDVIELANSGSLVATLNRMSADELRLRLDAAKLSTKGNKQILKSRLKEWLLRRAIVEHARANGEELVLAPAVPRPGPRKRTKGPQKQPFQYFLVVDFEATCDESNENYPHEIIEFPVVCVDTTTLEIVAEFREYCRPTINPTLSDFCVKLTGITQEVVDKADEFPAVFAAFEKWLDELGLGALHSFTFVTDGPWDFLRFFHMQCWHSGIHYPPYAHKWIDIRRTFGRCYKVRGGLTFMVQHLGLTMAGQLHCGLDDARNIAQVVIKMIKDGFWLDTNDKLPAKLR